MPRIVTRHPEGGFEIPSKTPGRRRAVLTKDGSTPIAVRFPNEFLLEIERHAAREMISVLDLVRRAVLNEVWKQRRAEKKDDS